MLLRLLVIVDAHEENVAGVVGYLRGIFLALDLVDGSVGRMIELQFNDECRLADVAARNHHEVGIALASGILPVNDILVPCPNITEIVIAFIDVHTHRFATVAGVVSLQFGGEDTNK